MKNVLIACFFLVSIALFGLDGDVDRSGEVNIVDALHIAQYYVDLPCAPFNAAVADVDLDGSIKIMDALYVAQYSTEFISYFPCSSYKRLPISPILQETNKCGPTAALMYITYQRYNYHSKGGTLPTQTVLYNQMRTASPTTGNGVTTVGLSTVLNQMLYKYTAITSQSYTTIYSKSSTSITDTTTAEAQLALIVLYEPSISYWYQGGVGHFVINIGFDHSKQRILYNDPLDGDFHDLDIPKWVENEYIVPNKIRVFIAKAR